MVTAYFCSETWMRNRTPLNANVDVALIVPFLGVAQELHIQPILGTALYERLMAGVTAGNLTPDETSLVELVRPALAYYTLSVAIPFVATQIRNSGIVKTKSDTVETASKAEVDALSVATANMADFYAQRVTKYLCSNSSSFPLYSTSDDMVPERSTNYSGGFYFPDDSCHCDLGFCSCGR